MRRGLGIVAVLLIVAAGLDFGVRLVFERVAEGAIEAKRGINGPVDVAFHGWPFLTKLASREFPRVTIVAEDVRGGALGSSSLARGDEAPVELVHLDALGVTLGDDGGRRIVRVRSGTGDATITGSALARMLPRDYAVEIEVLDGEIRVTGESPAGAQQVLVPEEGVRIEADDLAGRLRIDAPAPVGPLLIALPALVDGSVFRSVEVLDGSVRFTFTVRDVELPL
ncbi:MAG: DUF2993 domain-containing protein [Actinomycetota bacterium]|nr:DUF2993 domain-containing protein [Actinomycetota bacterium]